MRRAPRRGDGTSRLAKCLLHQGHRRRRHGEVDPKAARIDRRPTLADATWTAAPHAYELQLKGPSRQRPRPRTQTDKRRPPSPRSNHDGDRLITRRWIERSPARSGRASPRVSTRSRPRRGSGWRRRWPARSRRRSLSSTMLRPPGSQTMPRGARRKALITAARRALKCWKKVADAPVGDADHEVVGPAFSLARGATSTWFRTATVLSTRRRPGTRGPCSPSPHLAKKSCRRQVPARALPEFASPQARHCVLGENECNFNVLTGAKAWSECPLEPAGASLDVRGRGPPHRESRCLDRPRPPRPVRGPRARSVGSFARRLAASSRR